MNKRIIIRLVLIMVGAIAILGTLMAITTMPNENNNGFVRKWASEEVLEPVDTFHLEQDLLGIAGASEHSIFLVGNSPTGVLIINKITHAKQTLKINLNIQPSKIVPFYIKIDSPRIFLHINNASVLIDGAFPNSPFKSREIETGVFLKSIQLNDSIALIKFPDSNYQNQYLCTFDFITNKFKNIKNLIDKNGSKVGLPNDGMIFSDTITNSILYLEYFRNKIYCLDTNLILKYESNSIDTVASTHLTLAQQTKNDSIDKFTTSAARVPVNLAGTVYLGKLYVVSALRADNQLIREFNTHINIDVYDILSGTYQYSFKITKPEGKNLKSLSISRNILYVLFEGSLKSYPLKKFNI